MAVTAEARSLVRQSVEKGGLTSLGKGVLLSVSGIGSVRAATASRTLLENGAAALLSWGSAGGLKPDLSPGSLLLPKAVLASDRSSYHVDTPWHRRLCERLKGNVELHTEPLAESARVVRTRAEKVTLFRETGAIGVDMESGTVAAVAREARVPFMAVRAVADSADMTIPEMALNAVDEFGRLNLLKLMTGLAKAPTEFLALARIARDYRRAQRTLALVARLTGTDLLIS